MPSPSRFRSLLAVPLVALLVLAGCGDDGDTDAGDAADAATGLDEDAADGVEDDAADEDETDPLGAPETFCSAAISLGVNVPQAFVGSDEHLDALSEMAENAPPEIAEDARTWLQWAEEQAVEGDPGQEIEDYPPDVEDAVFNVEQYIQENCPDGQ